MNIERLFVSFITIFFLVTISSSLSVAQEQSRDLDVSEELPTSKKWGVKLIALEPSGRVYFDELFGRSDSADEQNLHDMGGVGVGMNAIAFDVLRRPNDIYSLGFNGGASIANPTGTDEAKIVLMFSGAAILKIADTLKLEVGVAAALMRNTASSDKWDSSPYVSIAMPTNFGKALADAILNRDN